MAVKKKGADFEQSLNALETLVNKMEQGDMTLEESLKAFETGIQLTRDCQARLAAAEQQVGGRTEGIEYEDAAGKWHGEVAQGDVDVAA